MKRLLTLLTAVAVAFNLNAQLPDYSICPDFTGTDLNGVEWNLYELLDQGKTVVIDVSATWCGPCWSYHNTHALDNLQDELGPAGTNEVMVLFIEGDPSTNLQCLYGSTGCNSTTQGDWVTGTTHPIIDDASIGDLLQISYFPTIYAVCPNRIIREVGQQSLNGLKNSVGECTPTPGLNYEVQNLTTDFSGDKICGTQVVTPSIPFLSSGTEPITSLTTEVRLNGAVQYTSTFNGNVGFLIPGQINLTPLTLSGTSIIKATITHVNGVELATPIVKQKSYSKAKETNTKPVTFTLNTDGYGEELYWEIITDQGDVLGYGGNEDVGPNGAGSGIASNTAPGAYADNTTITEIVEVPANGCYYLHMVDSYGDGLTSGTGYKLVETADVANVLITSGSGTFSERFSTFAATGIVGVADLFEDGTFRVYPNPANDAVLVDFSLKSNSDVQITLVNAFGQVVRDLGSRSYANGQNNVRIETANLASGVYFLSISNADGALTQRLSVQH
jgi:thiol-disulfide isomerase/thioredoxin